MRPSTTQPLPDRLEIGLSVVGQLRPIALLTLFLLAYPLGWTLDLIPGWLALVGVLAFAIIIVFGLITALRSRSRGWVVRLEPAGVTVRDHDQIPWTDLERVKVTGLQPGWFFLLGRRRYPVVALIPRPGVTLPALRLPGGPGPKDRLGRARERLYGTRLVLTPHAMNASVDEVAAAARDWGHLPVDFTPGVSPRRR